MELQTVRCLSQTAAPTDACADNRRGVLPVSGAGATVCSGHGLAEARRRHRSADHPFNGRIAPRASHPHRVASQSIPASSNVGPLPPACRGRFRRTRRARLGDRTHPVPDSALRGIERADPHRMAAGMHPQGVAIESHRRGPRQGPSSKASSSTANGTPAVVQE